MRWKVPLDEIQWRITNHQVPITKQYSMIKFQIRENESKKILLEEPGEYMVAHAPERSSVRGKSWWGKR